MTKRENSADFFARVREKSEAAIRRTAKSPTSSAVVDGSTWSAMARAIVEACAAGSPSPLAGAGFDVLRSLVGAEDTQTRLLHSIEKQVGILREATFLTGRSLIEDATRARDPSAAADLLHEAVREFRRAQHLANSLVERGVVETHLGVVWLLLGDRAESERWLATAHATLSAEAARMAAQADDVHVLKSRTATGFATYFVYPGVAVVAKKVIKVRRAEGARLALLELQPLLTAVSQSVAALGGEALPSFELTQGSAGWELRTVLPSPPS